MMEKKEISLSAILYVMAKCWKQTLLFMACVFLVCYGFIWYGNIKSANNSSSSNEFSISSIDNAKQEDINEWIKEKDRVEEYLQNSSFMKLNPQNLYYYCISYVFTWDAQNTEKNSITNNNDTIQSLFSSYWGSEKFVNYIINKNSEYKGKNIEQLTSLEQSGYNMNVRVYYMNKEEVEPLISILKEIVKDTSESYKMVVGNFDIQIVQEFDSKADGADIKQKQDEYNSYYKYICDHLIELKTGTSVNSKESENKPNTIIGIKHILICILAAIIFGMVYCFLKTLFGKTIYSSLDVSDITGKDVLCIIRSTPEKWVDKICYKKNEKYFYPERFLSITDKNLSEDGINNIYLFNCMGKEQEDIINTVIDSFNKTDVTVVSEDSKDSFYLETGKDEAVVILVKGQETKKKDLITIIEHLKVVRVKCIGVIFAV